MVTYFMSEFTLPKIGFGTWQNTDQKQCTQSVVDALTIGYRLIDTAQIYRNEEYVGQALQQTNIPREEIILCSKVWITNLSAKDVLKSTEESLEKLQTDYIDIMYVHWPSGKYSPEETLPAFAELVDQKKINYIAVSNFQIEHMETALDICDQAIVANQIELHPLHKEEELQEYLREQDIYVVAYSPLARGKVFNVDAITSLAKKYYVSEAQITLAWFMAKDKLVPIPKATSKMHIADNYEALKLKLDYDEIAVIDGLPDDEKLVNPKHSPWRK
jgi:2,5-diketo-D-gluconate reductase B